MIIFQKKFQILIIALNLLLLISCKKENNAEGSLKSFINYRFSKNQNKEGILEKMTNPLKEKYETLTPEEFDQLLLTTNLKVTRLKILNSNCEKEEVCYVTYLLNYDTFNEKNEKSFSTELKKIAELRLVDKQWKIADVNNVRTYHDSKEEIAP
jgi:hypothetical protein